MLVANNAQPNATAVKTRNMDFFSPDCLLPSSACGRRAIVVEPPGVMVGLAGTGFTVTTIALETSEGQLCPIVTMVKYDPDAVAE